MDWRDVTKIRLLADFDGSFFNDREEFIYTYLGNACNHNRTLEFVRSGYDMELLRKLEHKEN